jgi:hypothetical protein
MVEVERLPADDVPLVAVLDVGRIDAAVPT